MRRGERVAGAVIVVISLSSTLEAAVIIDFENLTDSTPVANSYAAQSAVFSGATVLSAGISLNEFEFPPHSGSNVAAADAGSITITFNPAVSSFSAYFTHSAALTLTAYGAPTNVLAVVHSAFNNNLKLSGDPGSTPNELLQIAASGITQITITGSGDFTLDDVSFTSAQCPLQLLPSYIGVGSGSTTASDSISAPCGWSATSNASWITIQAGASGSGTGIIQLSIASNSGLTRTGTVVIGGSQTGPQTLTVRQAGTDEVPPFGFLDTPLDGATGVIGAIGVTGWALDLVEVQSVKIYREPPPGQGSALAYIGDAVFVQGSRPDISKAYPSYPLNDQGWGLALLTNELPNGDGTPGVGNGTYRLHAIATNVAGQSIDLGVKTITVDNTHANVPFGTIDTPGQGATASGNAYVNFGWALTQAAYLIPKDGSTITVYIDNVPVGRPVYNNNRADISSLFPGLQNSNGAVGYYVIDTTKLINGLHTIAWGVTDSAGRVAGIGSRFFMVQN